MFNKSKNKEEAFMNNREKPLRAGVDSTLLPDGMGVCNSDEELPIPPSLSDHDANIDDGVGNIPGQDLGDPRFADSRHIAETLAVEDRPDLSTGGPRCDDTKLQGS